MTREITIRPMLNGFLCVVGCQCVVFTDKQSMLTQLSEYYDKPEEVEKRFIARAINKPINGPVPTEAPNGEALAHEQRAVGSAERVR